MASLLSAYLISNGAADTRYGGGQPKPDKDAKSEARSGGSPNRLDRHGRRMQARRARQQSRRRAGKPDADRLSRRPSRDTGAATPGGWSGRGRVLTPRSPRKPRLRPSKPTSTAAMDARPGTGRASGAGRSSTKSPAWVRPRPRPANLKPPSPTTPSPMTPNLRLARPTRPKPMRPRTSRQRPSRQSGKTRQRIR